MCRYAFKNYKSHYVCFECIKVMKLWDNESLRCPQCRESMVDMGRDFHAPRKNNNNQWKKLKLLHQQGIHFGNTCGCDGPGPRPKTYADAKAQKRERTL